MVHHVRKFEVFEVLIDSCRVCWLVVFEGDNLTLTDLGWGRALGFRGGIVMYVLSLPVVVYPVGPFGIYICSEGLCNGLDSASCIAICLLVKGGRRHEVNIECFVEFFKDIGDKLRSSIRDDFLGYSIIAVDLTYECIDDISGCVLLFHRH